MLRSLQIRIALLFLLSCCSAVSHTFAQSVVATEPRMVNGGNNESSKAELDLLAQAASPDKLIILIARRGSRESSRSVGRIRLKTASWFLQNVRAVGKPRIILAEGEGVVGEGRIEVYLDGKLFMIFVFRRNKDFAPEG
ncbi:MAG: hypothetical protein LC754_19145 [Acidobacteria bacterium]|nr:hypothetical protein [Acidobacteriota bacterium]